MPMLLILARKSADATVVTRVLAPADFTAFTGLAGARGWIWIPALPVIQAHVDEVAAP